MILSHARQLKVGSRVIAFNGTGTLHSKVVKIEPARNRLIITVRYKKQDGSIDEMTRTHRGFQYYGDFPSAAFPTDKELGIERALDK